MDSVGKRLERIRVGNRAERRERTITLVIVLCVAVGIACIVKWKIEQAEIVDSVENAGELVDATFQSGLTVDTTTIKTTKGTFRVYGTFQTVAGRPVEIRTFKNGEVALCDSVANSCKGLVE